ncbi:MAG: diacylglycerol kinase family protein [Candidatus Sericytochromatia bacterium]|nr:diacylglycerol kinase family protein [Candidatus Sericytochromatia bacterium]
MTAHESLHRSTSLDCLVRDPGARLAVVIYNPTAGSGPGRQRVELSVVQARFAAGGWQCATLSTQAPGDGAQAAQRALDAGADMVVAMGGDGTVNEVVQTLAYQDVPLGIIPTGTINILAREVNLPLEPLAAIDALVNGVPRTIDLGKANGRYFTSMIGLGYDAEATLQLLPQLKAWSGQLAYVVAAFRTYQRHRAVRARLVMRDEKNKVRRLRRLVYMMVVSNGGLYAGGVLKFSPDANMADGVLDACIIRSGRWYRALFHGFLTFLGRLHQVSDVEFFRATSIRFESSRPFPFQLDGDPAGHSPVTIEIAPAALRVVGPRDLSGE